MSALIRRVLAAIEAWADRALTGPARPTRACEYRRPAAKITYRGSCREKGDE